MLILFNIRLLKCLLFGSIRLPINMEHPFRWHTEYPLPNKATRVAEALETALEFSQHRATKQSSSDVVFQGDTPAQTFFTWLEHVRIFIKLRSTTQKTVDMFSLFHR